jgi:hypothetical protein
MNEHSSRSHLVITLSVLGANRKTGAKVIGKLNLIDLAGSERLKTTGATGDRLEVQHTKYTCTTGRGRRSINLTERGNERGSCLTCLYLVCYVNDLHGHCNRRPRTSTSP